MEKEKIPSIIEEIYRKRRYMGKQRKPGEHKRVGRRV